MDRTGGMENAHDTLAPECTGPEARFPHRLGRHRTPPIRSTGTLVCTLEHDVTGRISSTRCETDGRKLTEQRRYAPTSVHVRRNPCSRSPDLVFTFTGLRTTARNDRDRPKRRDPAPAEACRVNGTCNAGFPQTRREHVPPGPPAQRRPRSCRGCGPTGCRASTGCPPKIRTRSTCGTSCRGASRHRISPTRPPPSRRTDTASQGSPSPESGP